VRTDEERMRDVRAVVEAARRVVEQRPSVVGAIASSTGLSLQGVELALTRHLELDATDDEIRQLVARAGDAVTVAIILSANVFVGALRALAVARAASAKVRIKPSRRDPAFARALVEELSDRATVLDDALEVATVDAGEIHVYGRDETIAQVRAEARPGVRVRGHGAGMGIAWISRAAALEPAARALAEDVVAFDQRGCLSPRIAFVEGDVARAEELGQALHAVLDRLDREVPRGALPAEERAASERYVATMTYAHRALVGTGHAVGIAEVGAPFVLPPVYRHVHIAPCPTSRDAVQVLGPAAGAVIAVGSDDEVAARVLTPAWARLSPLGWMQRPPLDGPVDLRAD
jgi:acyl-CoA reductase-like NAD-dependent aldehyde dehydrogenase